jgi:hypothetical protein
MQFRSHQLRIQGSDGREYEIYVETDFAKRHIPDWDELFFSRVQQRFPPMMRGWKLQERLLSPRLLHFTPGDIMWKSCRAAFCQCCISYAVNEQDQIINENPYMRD